MKILIAEDDLVSRLFMKRFLSKYGDCDLAINGVEAIDLFMNSLETNQRYDLICLDIMMPKIDGIKVLKVIRELENKSLNLDENKSKIIMTTALNDKETIEEAYLYGCVAYAWKPIDINKFKKVLKEIGILK